MSVVITLMVIVIPKFKILQKLIDRINGVTRENLTGIRVVRAFNAENYQENKFNETNTKLTNQQLFNHKMFAIMQPMMNLVFYNTWNIFYRSIFNKRRSWNRKNKSFWKYGSV